MSNDVQETLKRLSTTFTVKGIMTPGPQLVCACNTEQAVTVSAGYPDFSVIPIRENGMITGFFQRDSHTTNKITVDNLISDGTNLLDLVDIFQQRDFSFVLSHQHIDGYVHYSDLNHQLVKWTFYVMLEAVERVALESIRPADERRYVAGKLGQERFEQIDRQYKRAGDNARSFLTYLNTADILRLAVKEGSIELEDITIRAIKEVRDWAAHVLYDLPPDTAVNKLTTVRHECLRILGGQRTHSGNATGAAG